MTNRRNAAETFALGMWANKAEGQLLALAGEAPGPQAASALMALQRLVSSAKTTGDLATLEVVKGYWDEELAARNPGDAKPAPAAEGKPAK